ncbi:hypothetical protein L3Y34_010312 [Caenorhabditis briggsae]|uniref:Uncharacterized protein n=1 Tax=Caenorhabditis briggsae TaxID=6238 RepID=A0AAE8ZR81_CAEBR|nr:hypothetical protein L3Y34_010312 [Caenorhabditis briggsae]
MVWCGVVRMAMWQHTRSRSETTPKEPPPNRLWKKKKFVAIASRWSLGAPTNHGTGRRNRLSQVAVDTES